MNVEVALDPRAGGAGELDAAMAIIQEELQSVRELAGVLGIDQQSMRRDCRCSAHRPGFELRSPTKPRSGRELVSVKSLPVEIRKPVDGSSNCPSGEIRMP